MNKETVDELLMAMVKGGEGISDLLFVAGKPPLVEEHGKLKAAAAIAPYTSELTGDDIERLAGCLMQGNPRLVDDFANLGSCDCSYSIEKLARFRVNVFKQNGRHAIVMRKLQSVIPTLDKLGLPPIFRQIVKEKTGVVFVTGGTGSGKTTTLAAMLNELNQTSEIHVVTLEDPIEFLHPHAKAAFSQRELGRDFPDFAHGLRAALRQAPKVIFVGEIRDRETMEIALTASETGHLVFSTLHTINAGQTVNRILGMFTNEEEQQVRQRLADTLRYVVSQRLVSRIDGGRLLVSEIMGNSMRTREVLLYGEDDNRSFQEIIESGNASGWHSFDQSLVKAFDANLITEETAMLFCTHKNKMRRDVDVVKKMRCTEPDAPTGFKLQVDPLEAARAARQAAQHQ